MRLEARGRAAYVYHTMKGAANPEALRLAMITRGITDVHRRLWGYHATWKLIEIETRDGGMMNLMWFYGEVADARWEVLYHIGVHAARW